MGRVGRGSLAGQAVRYHAGQVLALLLLSLLAVAACAFGPLYGRAVEGAQLRSTLDHSTVDSRGLEIRSGGGHLSVSDLLPDAGIGRYFKAPVLSTELAAAFDSPEFTTVQTTITSRAGLCQHVRIVAGHCADSPGTVVASTSSARVLHWTLGSKVAVNAVGLSYRPPEPSRPLRLTVVGLYSPFDANDDYWLNHPYSSAAGVSAIPSGRGTAYVADALFARAGFEQDLAASLPPDARNSVIQGADLALIVDRVGLDDIGPLRHGIAQLGAHDRRVSPGSNVRTTLGPLFDLVDVGRHQARTVIPVFAVELALLVLIVIGIVLVAAAGSRQHVFALARLRGRTVGDAAGLFERQLGVLILLAVVPGCALAWLGCALASRWWLSGRSGPELRWPVVASAAAVTVAQLLVLVAVARRAAGQPVQDMLQRVPRRVSRRGVGAIEAAVAAAAVGGTVVVLSGDKHNVLAVVTPGLIALAAGLLLARALAVAARVRGRRAFWRGRLSTGLAALQVARRPGSRGVVTLLCVAAALVVSAADQWSVAARNRSVRAAVEAGAPAVLTVQAASVKALQDAVSAADPAGRHATAVVVQRPPNADPVVAVDPGAFARIAGWGWARDRPSRELLARLTPPLPAPITVTGTALTLRLRDVTTSRRRDPDFPDSAGPANLAVRLTRGDGSAVIAKLPLPEGRRRSVNLTSAVACAGGCKVADISLLRATADTDTLTIDATLAGLSTGSPEAPRDIGLGPVSSWAVTTPDSTRADGTTQSVRLIGSRAGLRLQITNTGSPANLQHLDVPTAVSAIVAGPVSLNSDDQGHLSDNNIDGLITSYEPVGSIPLLPGIGSPALLVATSRASMTATPSLTNSYLQVWLDSARRERAIVAALREHGVTVVSRGTTAARRAALDASAPAWAMQLALATALLSVLIAALVIVITGIVSRRERAHDASALQITGIRAGVLRRASVLELTAAAAVAVAVGAVIGALGARLSLPAIPIFVSSAAVPRVLLPTAWASMALAALVSLAVLLVTAVAVALAGMRRLGPDGRR